MEICDYCGKSIKNKMPQKNSFKEKFKRAGKKITVPLIWFTIVILLISIVIIIQYALTKPLSEKIIMVILLIIFIIYLVWILLVSVIKYKKETLLNDDEKKAKWSSLSKEYKKFYRHMPILGISMSAFMLISGIWLIAIKDIYGWLMLILGISLLYTNIKLARRWKK